MTRYRFLTDTYETERLKTLSVWSEFADGDLDTRPRADDPRGRTVREHMIHQFVSEGGWFRRMLGIDVGGPPPAPESARIEFIARYARDSGARAEALAGRDDAWWEEEVPFFEVTRSRAWILVRRIAHTAHHRGQLTTLLRAWGRDLHSTYGPRRTRGGSPRVPPPPSMRIPMSTRCSRASAPGVASGRSRGPGTRAPRSSGRESPRTAPVTSHPEAAAIGRAARSS